MKKYLVIFGAVLIVAAYLVGYWPAKSRLAEANRTLLAVQSQLAQREQVLRIYRLQDQVLSIGDYLEDKNYGQAQKASTEFFDDARAASVELQRTEMRSSLDRILQKRDDLTGAISRIDPKAINIVRELRTELGSMVHP